MKIHSAFLSHVGLYREENQDSFFFSDNQQWFALTDGMGGHNNGGLASYLATQTFSQYEEFLKENQNKGETLIQMIVEAHYNIQNHQTEHILRKEMGTTAVFLYIDPVSLHYDVAWCGDSRLYHYKHSNHTLKQITKDHSYVQNLIDYEIINSEQAKHHKKKNILTSALGIGQTENLKIGHEHGVLDKKDILLLCSDGLTNEVSDDEIKNIVIENNNSDNDNDYLRIIIESLVYLALKRGGHDNVTVGIVGL